MRVGLFVTCLVDAMRPRIGFASLRLLEAAGCQVVVPENQTCCGQPGYNSGDRETAKALALKLLDEFEACDYVVAPSGSCAGMIRVHYPDLFRDDPTILNRISRLGQRTYELADFLVNVVKFDAVPDHFTGTLTYHDSCSGLRELGIRDQPRALLATMPGVTVKEMVEAATCCGFGGAFAVKFGELSTRMADNKCRHIEAAGVDAIVAGDLGCLLNIEGRLRRRGNHATQVLHIAEVLAGNEEDD
ncbi:(Fe-S)-binding protein [Sulfuriferula sp. GW1]|uniref:(Fe-S)-binding protein n=1 Tax=Sulfuriferula sp. GW1 TaxID=3345111 RepID=UPI0039B0321C